MDTTISANEGSTEREEDQSVVQNIIQSGDKEMALDTILNRLIGADAVTRGW